ncbi:MAG TPA: uroporphyrinogen decarboxylase family protein [Selenomonadales bacterium]|nr:uroporphyrinogen decarboxylase family protein [Selenomonadales bacterium]
MGFTEKERLLAALAKEKVDRPPVVCPGGMMSAATTAVLSARADYQTDPAAMAGVAEAIRETTGFENLGVPFCMTVEAELFGSTVALGDAGVEPCVTEYGAAALADILRQPLPDPDKDGRSPVVLEAIRLLASRHKDVPVIGNITGPVSLATSVMDPMPFFRLLRKAPEEVAAVLDHLTAYLISFARRQVACGADVIAIADPTATGEILGSANFRRFVAPLLQRLAGEIRAAGAGLIIHICGDAKLLLPALRQVDGAAFSFDSLVDMRAAKQGLDQAPVMGNLNTQLLHTGEPQRIASVARLLLNAGIDILSPACGISLATPRENLAAFTSTVKELGSLDRA